MGVEPDIQRSIDSLLFPVVANGLRNSEDMPVIKCPREGGAAMSGRPERDTLLAHRRIGPLHIVSGDQLRDVYQHRRLSRFPCPGTHVHLWRSLLLLRVSDTLLT